MKTILDELKQEVKNWWLIHRSGLEPDVFSIQRICNFKYSLQHLHAVQWFIGNSLRCK